MVFSFYLLLPLVSSIQIPYHKTNLFSALVQDYLSQNDKLSPFYNRHNSVESYKNQIEEKGKQSINRELLVDVLAEQNNTLILSEKSLYNMESLKEKTTFTVTTGHQLCLFTGPLYFIYKIVSCINLAKSLKEKYPSHHFVPVFWMATEDHDFEEINHITLFGKKIEWDSGQTGAVGQMTMEGMPELLKTLENIMGDSDNAKHLKSIFEKAYSSKNLSLASRVLINELFADDGLLIIDGDDAKLKKEFISIMKKDIIDKSLFSEIASQTQDLEKFYKSQAFVREINFFKLEEGSRKRIDGGISANEIESNPQSFSPNVLLRPLYQEMLLPNLSYIGGGAELSYWMQLKSLFDQEEIPYPILVLRNSALIISKSQHTKIEKLGMSVQDVFLSENEWHKKYIGMQTDIKTIESEIDAISQLFNQMKTKFSDVASTPIIDAEHHRQRKALSKLSQKLYKIEKQKYDLGLSQLSKMKHSFFPNNSLQERHDNFIPYYLKYGDNFIKKLKEEFNPQGTNFVVLLL